MDIAVVVNVDHSGLDKVLNQVVSDLVVVSKSLCSLQLLSEILNLRHMMVDVSLSCLCLLLFCNDLLLRAAALAGDLHKLAACTFGYYR